MRTYIVDWNNYSNKQIQNIQEMLDFAYAQIHVKRIRTKASLGDCYVLAATASVEVYSYIDVKIIIEECILQLCKSNNF